jgi:SAM-dependent methyltransferase
MKYRSCTEYWLDTKTGKFRGEFEAMYRDIEDPWGCFKGAESLNNKLFCQMLFHERRFSSTLDLGCGLGGLADVIRRINGGRVVGCDISTTAVEKACQLFPEIGFVCLNVLEDDVIKLGRFDLIIMAELLWYILDDLDGVLNKVCELMNPGSLLGIHQYFPDKQNFGADIINGLEGFDAYIDKKGLLEYENKLVSYCDDGRVLLAALKRIGG